MFCLSSWSCQCCSHSCASANSATEDLLSTLGIACFPSPSRALPAQTHLCFALSPSPGLHRAHLTALWDKGESSAPLPQSDPVFPASAVGWSVETGKWELAQPLVGRKTLHTPQHDPFADRESLGCSVCPQVGCVGRQTVKLFWKTQHREGVSGGQGGPCIPASTSLTPEVGRAGAAGLGCLGSTFLPAVSLRFVPGFLRFAFPVAALAIHTPSLLSAKAGPERAGALGSLCTLPPELAVPAITSHFKALPLPALPPAAGAGEPPPSPALGQHQGSRVCIMAGGGR